MIKICAAKYVQNMLNIVEEQGKVTPMQYRPRHAVSGTGQNMPRLRLEDMQQQQQQLDVTAL